MFQAREYPLCLLLGAGCFITLSFLVENSTVTLKKKKKKAKHESYEISFIWGQMRTLAQETASLVTLRHSQKKEGNRPAEEILP